MTDFGVRHVAILMLLAVPTISVAKSDAPSASASEVADTQARTFFDLLKAGKNADAVEGLMKASPLWATKPGSREAVLGQINAAVRAYGPITGYEKISADTVGSMAVRERYFVQHRDMVARWEIDFLRTGNGWSMGYFGFTDTPQTWFPAEP